MKIRTLELAGLILMLALSDVVHAQSCQWRQEGTVGPGWYDASGSTCSNSSPQQPITQQVNWASRWGAIAISYGAGHSGSAAGQESSHDAKHLALRNCNVNGTTDCKVALTYRDQCAALAWGGGFSAPASAATIEEASLLALHSCGAGECKIVYSECSLPERIQ